MSIIIQGVSYDLPIDEFQAQKVTPYNVVLQALAGVTEAAWTPWTPTWTNLSVGNGTVVAKYVKFGKTIFARLSLVWGSSTSISGAVSFSLPITRTAYGGTANRSPLGISWFWDSSAALLFEGGVGNLTTTTGSVLALGSGGTYLQFLDLSSTVPFTWATSDEINVECFYEAA